MVKGLPDSTQVVFDDRRAVANAGMLLPGVLAERLGVESLIDEAVVLGDRAGAANAGRKVMTLVSAMALGADCIDDCDALRSGQTRVVVTVPSAVVIRPDGYVAWVGDGTALGLRETLTTWFGPPTAV